MSLAQFDDIYDILVGMAEEEAILNEKVALEEKLLKERIVLAEIERMKKSIRRDYRWWEEAFKEIEMEMEMEKEKVGLLV